jgi:hypothetical protein
MITIKKFIQINNAIEAYRENQNRLTVELTKILSDNNPNISFKEAETLIIKTMIEVQKEGEFVKTFTLNGIKYGFHPNLNNLSVGEWIDIDNYQKDSISNAHKLMSILYRPIIKQVKDNYEIEPYDGTKNAELMLEVDSSIFKGMMLFFWNLSKELIQGSDTYIQKQMTLMKKNQPTKES